MYKKKMQRAQKIWPVAHPGGYSYWWPQLLDIIKISLNTSSFPSLLSENSVISFFAYFPEYCTRKFVPYPFGCFRLSSFLPPLCDPPVDCSNSWPMMWKVAFELLRDLSGEITKQEKTFQIFYWSSAEVAWGIKQSIEPRDSGFCNDCPQHLPPT